ncbi:hypothetical protein [Lapillicoccus sp.]|uniref:hypothetical protein n=1 Tax=Lapillicoccus sp. TaxID=1909287 RepID=UPI003266A8B3
MPFETRSAEPVLPVRVAAASGLLGVARVAEAVETLKSWADAHGLAALARMHQAVGSQCQIRRPLPPTELVVLSARLSERFTPRVAGRPTRCPAVLGVDFGHRRVYVAVADASHEIVMSGATVAC